MKSAQPEGSLPAVKAVVTAGATGFGVMAAELTAVRLLAPHFGDSAYVWTNVIGVILAAMAIGAMLGGRLSSKVDADKWPFRLLLVAGGLLLLAPFTTSWLGTTLLPSDLQLDAAMPALIRGSLVATAVVFAPPMMLLAAVSPLLIVLLANSGRKVGRAAGDIAAAGTVGSLLGTFAATHFLVPNYGCRIAMTVSAGVLLLAAFVVAPRHRRPAGVAALLAALAMTFAHGGPLRPAKNGIELLAERETAYQFLQVHRSKAESQPERTTLVINEALDSFHSLAIEGSAFTQNAYYDWHAIAPLLAGDGKRPKDMQALSIGDAAGTLRRVYAAIHPGVVVDAVDIDAETMALGDEFFGGDKAAGARYAIDGRLFLSHTKQQWHVIHVDAYAHQVYIPAHLASIEFFEAAYSRLHKGGILACNVGALSIDDPVLKSISTTVSSVFGNVRTLLIPGSRNALLIARRDMPLKPEQLSASDKIAHGTLSPSDAAHWRDIIQTSSDPDNWHELPANDHVLVDDQPLLDELLLQSYIDSIDQKSAVTCNGDRRAMEAERRATSALERGDWHSVLKAVESSTEETALLRRLAGDARWYRRELRSAELEYRAGLSAHPDPEMKLTLEGRLRGAAAELAPTLRAESAATRNGWLAILCTLVGAVLFVAIRRN